MKLTKGELQSVLGYLNVGLAIAHNTGVSVGHFGNTDFIGLAETVNGLLLRAVSPVNADGVEPAAAGALISAVPVTVAAATAQ